MTRFLRTASPRRLAGTLLAALALVGGGAAIAVAATSGGPVARTRPLAAAIHSALAAAPVQGLTATVTFTNRLIDAADLQGSDPLLSGATGRLWISKDRLRLELQSSGGNGDAQLVVDGRSFWAFDPSSNTVYRGTFPAGRSSDNTERPGSDRVPGVGAIGHELSRLAKYVSLSQAIGTDVAGQPAYQVRLSPKLSGGMLGWVQLAWDAAHGVPLSFGIYAKGDPDPVLALTATHISYGALSAADFAAAPPAGAHVQSLTPGAGPAREHSLRKVKHGDVEGLSQVAAKLPFSLDAPDTLAGRARNTVRLVHLGARPAALITYGHDLDGLAVIETSATSGKREGHSSSGDGGSGLSLPTVSLPGGVSGTELDTALGSLVHFQRGGVSYTLLGSVPRTVVDEAARSL